MTNERYSTYPVLLYPYLFLVSQLLSCSVNHGAAAMAIALPPRLLPLIFPPFIAAPRAEKYCSRCGVLESVLESILTVCSVCNTALYCSDECQHKDWPMHLVFCIIWANPQHRGRLNLHGPPLSITTEWLDAYNWLHYVAPVNPAARELAAGLGVDLDCRCLSQRASCRLIE